MSTGVKAAIGVGVAFMLIAFISVIYVFSVKNTAIRFDNDIDAQYSQNQNNLATYINTVMDMVQVPDMAKDHIKEVAQAAIQGRYGAEGSKALFQAINEQNPTVDAVLYRNIEQKMEAGRESFANEQKILIDKCATYKTWAESAPESMFVTERNNTEKCTPVTNAATKQAFATKQAEALKIR